MRSELEQAQDSQEPGRASLFEVVRRGISARGATRLDRELAAREALAEIEARAVLLPSATASYFEPSCPCCGLTPDTVKGMDE